MQWSLHATRKLIAVERNKMKLLYDCAEAIAAMNELSVEKHILHVEVRVSKNAIAGPSPFQNSTSQARINIQ